jgi:arsenite methyltransferase
MPMPDDLSASHLRSAQPGQRADYGLDAPAVVRNLLMAGAVGLVFIVTRMMGTWNAMSHIALVGYPAICAGMVCGAMGLWMIYYSRIGKVRSREKFLDQLDWHGDELVLDVGCGRGLFLIGAAKRLTGGGRAVGVDFWQAEDLSGNSPAAATQNALLEGVADCVDIHTADARQLPFAGASFDVVLSSVALHNIYDAAQRETAVREIARVLKPGGKVLIVDIRYLSQYAAILLGAGLADARSVTTIGSRLLTAITFGSLRTGHVVASKPVSGRRLEGSGG